MQTISPGIVAITLVIIMAMTVDEGMKRYIHIYVIAKKYVVFVSVYRFREDMILFPKSTNNRY